MTTTTISLKYLVLHDSMTDFMSKLGAKTLIVKIDARSLTRSISWSPLRGWGGTVHDRLTYTERYATMLVTLISVCFIGHKTSERSILPAT